MPRGPDPKYSDKEILEVFARSPDPAFFAVEIADEFDMSDQWARNRLGDLVDEGYVLTKKPSRQSRVYWISREGKEYLQDSSESSESQ